MEIDTFSYKIEPHCTQPHLQSFHMLSKFVTTLKDTALFSGYPTDQHNKVNTGTSESKFKTLMFPAFLLSPNMHACRSFVASREILTPFDPFESVFQECKNIGLPSLLFLESTLESKTSLSFPTES